MAETNLDVLRVSRKRPEPGDIFVYRMRNRDFGFGRVIRTDVQMLDWKGIILIYVYGATCPEKHRVPRLDKSKLLIPPSLTDRTPWTKGYFETVENRPLVRDEHFARHCFFDDIDCCCRDEYGHSRRRAEPCGEWWLGNCYTLDDDISKALGISCVEREGS